jgi:hypothetical protein
MRSTTQPRGRTAKPTAPTMRRTISGRIALGQEDLVDHDNW